MIDLTGGNPGDKAAANITKIIEAAANAKTAQVELQKQVMLKKIGDQMDIQKNIAQKQANLDWVSGLGNNQQTSTPAATPAATPLNPLSGVADSDTAASIAGGGKMASPVPQTPPMSMASPAQQPANNAQSQLTMPAVSQPPVASQPPSVQYTNLGYTPVEAQQLVQQRRAAGQTVNMGDSAYVMALQKVKAGTASQAELDMVNKMNNKDGNSPTNQTVPSTNLEVQPTSQMGKIQAGLRAYEKMSGAPEGSMWLNPSTQEPEISPIWKSKQEAIDKYNITAPDRYGKLAEQDLMHIFSMRSGALGVQDAKINQALHVKQLFDQSYDPKTGIYNLKAPQFAEATQALAVLVSNSNQTSEGQRQEIKQRTLAGDFNGALTYAFGIPKNATSQEIAKMYIASVDRQGLTAQAIKEKDISDIKNLDSFNQLKKIDPERAKNLYEANFGFDYRDFIKKPWEERIKAVTGESPSEEGAQGGGNASGGNEELQALLAEKARRSGGK